MLRLATTKLFEKDLNLVEKRGKNLNKIEEVLRLLVTEQVLDPLFRDHPLKGNWAHYRELHIESDWLLIYKKTEEAIIAVRTGTHSDLF